ncbi:MAG TPA: hypothetical protein PLU72_01540 [Candidatus Ozemobacteraceae bacterium]|nr:hypothetical protein [Candidatus Ozemobacteraceae bacterium]HQG28651.1 hypothetical protein [Candidatus Ozemobacteraceae bacterium]
MTAPVHSDRLGMSMVEVMIGVIILALVLIPSLNVIISETKTVNATRDHTQASFFAQKILESAHACKFDLLDADQYDHDPATQKTTFEYMLKNNEDFRTETINGIKYEVVKTDKDQVKYAADKNDPDIRPNMVFLSFTVKYTGQDKNTHTLDIHTAINKRQ